MRSPMGRMPPAMSSATVVSVGAGNVTAGAGAVVTGNCWQGRPGISGPPRHRRGGAGDSRYRAARTRAVGVAYSDVGDRRRPRTGAGCW
jgi:hypothetical protein